jgi:hypothetical protein
MAIFQVTARAQPPAIEIDFVKNETGSTAICHSTPGVQAKEIADQWHALALCAAGNRSAASFDAKSLFTAACDI